MSEIRSEKIYIRDVFNMWFRIPEYQRPYVWGNDQINDLLDDLNYAATHNPHSDYFLGSFVFQHNRADRARSREFDENDLLDGQQRLTTLFLLMAVARDITASRQLKETCCRCIFQEGNPYMGIPEVMRIQFKIRREVERFVEDFIKPEGGTLRHPELAQLVDSSQVHLSIRNMANAVLQIHAFFTGSRTVSLDVFFRFLFNKVLMVYVSSEDMNDALRMFTILNDRGIKLNNSDIFKADNLRELGTEAEKARWGKFWEELESEYQQEGFDRFLSWIRTLLVKEKARLNLLKEFEDNIYHPKEKDKTTGAQKPVLLRKGLDTFRLLERYHSHHQRLFEGNNYDFCNSWAFDNLLGLMGAVLPSTDWVPPLLRYYDKFGSTYILAFLHKLDNKFSADWIAQYTPTDRIDNMNTVLKAIEAAPTAAQLLQSDVFVFDQAALFRNLEGPVYGRQFAKYVLFKLDYLCFDNHSGKMTIPHRISVEHILPQHPTPNSQWTNDFTDAQRQQYTHQLGNLILLGRNKNSSLNNREYVDKKDRYFSSAINTFPNSLRVMNRNDYWTPDEVEGNQRDVLAMLRNCYSR